MYIYDPSYDDDDRPLAPPRNPSSRRRLNEMTMIGAKVGDLIRLLRDQRKLRVDKIFIGGGGNVGGDCRKMTLEWIKGWVEDLIEGRPEREMLVAEWEELRP